MDFFDAIALCEVGQKRPGRSWKEDKDLMAFLKSCDATAA